MVTDCLSEQACEEFSFFIVVSALSLLCIALDTAKRAQGSF